MIWLFTATIVTTLKLQTDPSSLSDGCGLREYKVLQSHTLLGNDQLEPYAKLPYPSESACGDWLQK